MARLAKRIGELERRSGLVHKDERAEAVRESIKGLTTAELRWLLQPAHEAQRRVPCPHVEKVGCACKSAERQRRGFEAHPELCEEYARRSGILKTRSEA